MTFWDFATANPWLGTGYALCVLYTVQRCVFLLTKAYGAWQIAVATWAASLRPDRARPPEPPKQDGISDG